MTTLHQIAPGVLVASDERVPLVPNIGIVEGKRAILIIDTGLGPANGTRVYEAALRLAKGRKIYLTTTHFHPEHSFGASAFPAGSLIMNEAQANEMAEKGPSYLARFREIGPDAKAALDDTVIAKPAITYRGRHDIDLGGIKVELREMPAHTRGDQTIFLPASRVLFTGDLAETRFFPVLIDEDSNGLAWIDVLRRLEAMRPAIIVPGHGEVTDIRLIQDVRGMLEWLQKEVRKRMESDPTTDQLVAELQTAARLRYPSWDNGQYLHYDILHFRSEALANPNKNTPQN